jgi:hypothetical protein
MTGSPLRLQIPTWGPPTILKVGSVGRASCAPGVQRITRDVVIRTFAAWLSPRLVGVFRSVPETPLLNLKLDSSLPLASLQLVRISTRIEPQNLNRLPWNSYTSRSPNTARDSWDADACAGFVRWNNVEDGRRNCMKVGMWAWQGRPRIHPFWALPPAVHLLVSSYCEKGQH